MRNRCVSVLALLIPLVFIISCGGNDSLEPNPSRDIGMSISNYRLRGSVNIYRDRIYYHFPIEEDNVLYSCDLDGTDIVEISRDVYGYLNIWDGNIYCSGDANDPGIKRISLDTLEKTSVTNEWADSLFVCDGNIAYLQYDYNSNDVGTLYLYKSDKEILQVDSAVMISFTNYLDGNLYYAKTVHTDSIIYRYNIELNETVRLATVSGAPFELIGRSIVHGDSNNLYLTNMDTLECEQILELDEPHQIITAAGSGNMFFYNVMDTDNGQHRLFAYELEEHRIIDYGNIACEHLAVIGSNLYSIGYFSGNIKKIDIENDGYNINDIIINTTDEQFSQ